MTIVEPSQRRWLVLFAATLAVLVGTATWLSLRLLSFREPPFDFYSMKPGEIFNVYGLTRRQEGSVKLGFAEAYPPPEIGLFGNHIAGYFGSDAFNHPDDPAFFFNYYYANLSLPEIRSYLLRVEQKGHLPRELILVQITAPNADNGKFIINLGNELPPDIMLRAIERDEFWKRPLSSAAVVGELIDNWLHEILNYNTFILSMIQSGGYKDRTVNPAACPIDIPRWLLPLPAKLQNVIGSAGGFDIFCLRRLWEAAYRRDGSQYIASDATAQDPATVVQNEDPLRASDRGLRAGDEVEIARQMRAIEAIGVRHGIKVVFIVPPVYETDRHDSVVNQIFNRALTLVPDIPIIDNRGMHNDPSLFEYGIHPSGKYFRIVVDELRRQGVVK
jgi:hypothetical protein